MTTLERDASLPNGVAADFTLRIRTIRLLVRVARFDFVQAEPPRRACRHSHAHPFRKHERERRDRAARADAAIFAA